MMSLSGGRVRRLLVRRRRRRRQRADVSQSTSVHHNELRDYSNRLDSSDYSDSLDSDDELSDSTGSTLIVQLTGRISRVEGLYVIEILTTYANCPSVISNKKEYTVSHKKAESG